VTLEMGLTLGILAAAILLFLTEWVRVDVVALLVVAALMLTGLLPAQDAVAGFANPAVLTIAALFIVGGGVVQTGLAGLIGQSILRIAGKNEALLVAVIMGAVALLSSMMSSSGTVAVLLPAIVSLARSARVSPSRLLIPLAFGALLGGALTLIGTPPNIIVSDLLSEAGLQPFGFFDFTPIGLALLAAGTLFVVLIGRRLLPAGQPVRKVQWVETPEQLVDLYRLPDDLFQLRVRRESALAGQTIADSRLGQDFGVTVLEIRRPAAPGLRPRLSETLRGARANAAERMAPRADSTIAAGDILVVRGSGNDVGHAAAFWNLGLQPAQAEDEDSLVNDEIGIAEVLLPPRSALAGRTLVEARFGTLYRLTVLGIQRPNGTEKLDLKQTPLRVGDILLVQGSWRNILALRDVRRDFVVMGEPEAAMGAPTRRKVPLAILVLVGMLVLMAGNLLPVVTVSLLAALAMMLTGCISIDEAYKAVDWKSVVLIAGMLPMSTALERVGLVSVTAQGLIGLLGTWGPLAVLAGIFLLVAVLTQVLSNTATTVLVAPIALAAAQGMGVQPYAFMMAVAMAASMAFATPVASPVNTLVMGAGNYRFGDYARVGVPLILLTMLVSVLVLPLLWPL